MRSLVFLPLALVVACQPPAAPGATRGAVAAQATAAPVASAAPAPAAVAAAPPARDERQRVTFRLHKFLSEIGTEVDTTVATADGGTEAKAVFSFRDRWTTVPLAATLTFDRGGAWTRYAAWGSTSRFSTIDDRVTVLGDPR